MYVYVFYMMCVYMCVLLLVFDVGSSFHHVEVCDVWAPRPLATTLDETLPRGFERSISFGSLKLKLLFLVSPLNHLLFILPLLTPYTGLGHGRNCLGDCRYLALAR
jgi:hypothetical protein